MRWWWRRATSETAPSETMPTVETVCQPKDGSVLERASTRWQHLAPSDGSAGAFVTYLRTLSERAYEKSRCWDYCGVWVQADLYNLYEEVCQVFGLDLLGPRVFGRELRKAGCRRWQADNRECGTGSRPMMIEIPRTPLNVAKAVVELAASGSDKAASPNVALASNVRVVPRVRHWTAEGTLGKRVHNNKSLKARPSRNFSPMEVAA